MNITARSIVLTMLLLVLLGFVQVQSVNYWQYDPANSLVIQEEFISGNAANLQIGTHGFGFIGGTASFLPSETNRFGLYRRDTSATINTLARTELNSANVNIFEPSVSFRARFDTRLNQTDTDTQMRIGFANTFGSPTPSNGIFFEKLFADTNWFCKTVSGGTPTRVDSGVATSTSFVKHEIFKTGGTVTFAINGTSVCNSITTNIPTVFLEPGWQMQNQVAVSKTYDIDFFFLRLEGLSR